MIIKVGIDYDEPLFPWYDYAHDASVAAGLTTQEQPPPTSWDPHSHYGCSIDDWYEALNQEVLKGADGMYGRPLKPGVVDDLRRLYTKGYDVHIITARGSFGAFGERIKRLTVQQLIRENVPYMKLHFAPDKHQVIKDLGVNYMLDDRPKHYMEAESAGAETYLLDERWNQDFWVPASRRLYTLRQYVDLIIDKHGDLSKMTERQKSRVFAESRW